MIDFPEFFVGQLKAIRSRVLPRAADGRNLHYEICETLNSLRERMCKAYPGELAFAIASITQPVRSSRGNPEYPGNSDSALLLCDQLLQMLQPTSTGDSSPISRITPKSRTVFIVHGHDEANLLRLQRLLKERFDLKPVILMEEPSSGQTIIEKFERAANEAAFCLVLMTPDDQVRSQHGDSAQARPNVIFELGWFYGRLGRSRVCILSKEAPPFILTFRASSASSSSKILRKRFPGLRGNSIRLA